MANDTKKPQTNTTPNSKPANTGIAAQMANAPRENTTTASAAVAEAPTTDQPAAHVIDGNPKLTAARAVLRTLTESGRRAMIGAILFANNDVEKTAPREDRSGKKSRLMHRALVEINPTLCPGRLEPWNVYRELPKDSKTFSVRISPAGIGGASPRSYFRTADNSSGSLRAACSTAEQIIRAEYDCWLNDPASGAKNPTAAEATAAAEALKKNTAPAASGDPIAPAMTGDAEQF